MPHVHVLLGIDDATKAWLLGHCEAFLFPSLAEGFGLPPLEAMYFGAPVFLSHLDDFSPQSMRATIESELPRLRAQRDDIRRRARQFDWSACVAKYAQLYGELSAQVV